MGRKIDPQTVNRAKELFNKGLAPSVVARRLNISESMARNIQREMPKKPVSTEESAV
jgi:ribosomal protein S25